MQRQVRKRILHPHNGILSHHKKEWLFLYINTPPEYVFKEKRKVQSNVFSMLSYIKEREKILINMYGHTFLLYFLRKKSLEGQMKD